MAAALLSAIAMANAAICQHVGVSMHVGGGDDYRCGREEGGGG